MSRYSDQADFNCVTSVIQRKICVFCALRGQRPTFESVLPWHGLRGSFGLLLLNNCNRHNLTLHSLPIRIHTLRPEAMLACG